MSGIAEFNYPAFHAAAAHLRSLGLEVVNPAENFSGDQSLPWSTYLRQAIQDVARCDSIVLMSGWQRSSGAVLENHIAEQLGHARWLLSEDGELTPVLDAPAQGRLSSILADVAAELGRAIRKHPPIHSPHEGYAVLLEEVDELLDAGASRDVMAEHIHPPLGRLWTLVKADKGRTGEARAEALQVAAMALRYILDLDLAAAA